jgi:antirestriction protein ArdC
MSEKVDVNQIITDRVVQMLEDGKVPWRKPWAPGAAHRSINQHAYRGINVFLLGMEAQMCGYVSPFWITFKQAKERGGAVRKGEKSTLITFWKRLKVVDKESGDDKIIPMLRYYRVFNVEQTEDVKLPAAVANWEPPAQVEGLADADRILNQYLDGGPRLSESATEDAFYVPARDAITVPMKSRFADLADFYSTVFHEVGHSTGHPSRLDRYVPAAFGSHTYGLEELVAEMTATMLCGEAGIEGTVENSAAYLASWITTIREDPKVLVKAAGQAQRAADLVMGRTFEQEVAA